MERKSRNLLVRLFGSSDKQEPLDFQSLVCQQVKVSEVATNMDLRGKAESNGSADLPPTSSTQLDGPQREIKTYFNGRVGRIIANYEQRLKGLNQMIESRDVHLKVSQAERMDEDLQSELRHLGQREEVKIDRARRDYVNYYRDYISFRKEAGISREPNYPDSRGLQWSLVIFACLAEAIVNAIFYYQGIEYGIAGGLSLALVLAIVDISILFAVGRGAARIVSKRIDHKAVGALLCILFIVWAVGYNLGTAHIREQLQGDVVIQAATELALSSFITSPFGLSQADSWVLFAFGVFFSAMAFGSGYSWDEKIPGYGKKHRELNLLREDYDHLVVSHKEKALEILKEKRKDLERTIEDATSELNLLKHDVETKETLFRIVTTCIEHNTDSCVTLVQIYRDENQKGRSTPPPDYFDEPIELQVEYPERHDPTEDLERINMYDKQLGGVRSKINQLQSRLDAIYEEYVQGLDLRVSKDLDLDPTAESTKGGAVHE